MEFIPKEKRKRILLLSDDMRAHSGVATMSREIVRNTCEQFNWIQLGALINHPEKGKIMDMSKSFEDEGFKDPEVQVLGWNDYGNQELLRDILNKFEIDAIVHFTDPRQWEWLYRMEGEIRKDIPLIFYTIWDDLPYPYYNRSFYDSCDGLYCISRQTENLVRQVLGEVRAKGKNITYIPHGIDKELFKPLTPVEEGIGKEFIVDGKRWDFIIFHNARNIRRKNTSDIILAYRLFLDSLPKDKAKKCLLYLHTQAADPNGTDLNKVCETLIPDEYNVIIDEQVCDTKKLNEMYNNSDCHFFLSSNEGWGLGLTESLMAGRMIIAPVTGGMQDQMRFQDEGGNWIKFNKKFPTNHNGRYKQCGEWAIPMFPSSRSVKGSIPTPYIFDDTVSIEDAVEALKFTYELGRKERLRRGAEGRKWVTSDESNMTSENMGKLFYENLTKDIENFVPKEETFTITSIEDKESNYNEVAYLIKE